MTSPSDGTLLPQSSAREEHPRGSRAVDDWEVLEVSPADRVAGEVRRSSPFAALVSRAGVAISELVGSRESTPQQRRTTITYDSLMERPRSNPRTRTPMRYESPLSATAFRRGDPEDVSPPPRREGQRVTVRPLVASVSVGSIPVRRSRDDERERPVTPVSSKQGPSHRKVRRWNNDNFVGIASELAGASSRGPEVAQTLLQAKADAPMYLSVFDPRDCAASEKINKFMSDDSMKVVRDEFYAGEIGVSANTVIVRRRKSQETKLDAELSPEIMMNRIHERLRKVVVRACINSAESAKLVNSFERYLIRCFCDGKKTSYRLSKEALQSLLEPPTVTRRRTGHTIVRFYFSATSTSGGFHRLLLHAVAQFHGLHAVSTTIEFETKVEKQARLLTVMGSLSGAEFCLVDYANDGLSGSVDHAERASKPSTSEVPKLSDSLNALRVGI